MQKCEAGQRSCADPGRRTRRCIIYTVTQGKGVLFGSHMKSNSFTSSWGGWFIQMLAAAQHDSRLCSWWSAWRRQREAIRGASAEIRRAQKLEARERSLLRQASVSETRINQAFVESLCGSLLSSHEINGTIIWSLLRYAGSRTPAAWTWSSTMQCKVYTPRTCWLRH